LKTRSGKIRQAFRQASPITTISDSPITRASIAEAKRELDNLGVGALASRLVGGERSTHKPFEAEIAKFLGFERR